MLKLLHKGDESQRGWKIIEVSRARDAAYLPQLLARLDSDETHHNKRHIVRALGNIGGDRAEARLLELLQTSTGLMLSDVIRSLGRLRSRKAAARIRSLLNHEMERVRQDATWAMRRITGEK